VLAAVNHLGRQGARVAEAGMQPLEAVYPTPGALAQVRGFGGGGISNGCVGV
jgi:hypothetical protein